MQTVLILGAPRTGTNYLLNLLAHRPDVRAHHEIFHPAQAFGYDADALRMFCRLTGDDIDTVDDERLPMQLARWPEAAVRCLRDVAERSGAQFMFFKMFPGHGDGTIDTVERVLRHVDAAVFVKRRILDSYISVTKALAVGQFFGMDTTGLRPKLDVDHFVEWYRETSLWHIRCTEAWMRRFGSSDVPVLRYDEFTAGAGSSNLRSVEELLCDRVPLAMPASGAVVTDALERQDRGSSPHHKVANYDEFAAALARKGLDGVLNRHF